MEEKLNQIIHTLLENQQQHKITLMGDQGLGTTCLLAYHSLYKQENLYQDVFYKALEDIQATLAADEVTYTHTFCNGLAGLGWFLQHLIKKGVIDIDLTDLFLDLDEVVFDFAMQAFETNGTDFLHGPVGHACYLVNRLGENPAVETALLTILDKLEATSISSKNGIYWYDHHKRDGEEDKNIINFSLSHGLASKLVLFAKLLNANFDTERVKRMLQESCRFMLSYQNPKTHFSILPDRLPENEFNTNFPPTRLGWCYGDLGNSIALWQAGVALNDEHIKQQAVDICLHTSKRKDSNQNKVLDAGLCHGAAGIAHIYKRMHDYTQVDDFREASDYWLSKTLEMAYHEDGLAGFKTHYNQPSEWVNDDSFLTGISGIGLMLLSQLYPNQTSDWDECLLLS